MAGGSPVLAAEGATGRGGTSASGAGAAGQAGGAGSTLEFGRGGAGGSVASSLADAHRAALTNLFDVNTVPYDPATYDRTGLMSDPPGVFIRAGGGYEQPWTRDASVNTWNAASSLSPGPARNTLWSVVDRQDDGSLIVLQDNQWWDQIIWAVAAWHHYRVTGDRAFLTDAYATAVHTLRRNRAEHYNARYGLFEGPAFMQDGIAGYPSPPYDPDNDSSFVLDHPDTDKLMSLSTNCLYHAGYLACAAMAEEKGERREAAKLRAEAARLRRTVNARLWRPEAGTYGYFLHGIGERVGRLEPYEEAGGLALAVLCGVASPAHTRSVLARTHREPHGVVNVWPHFPRFDDAHPGRHNVTVWPMVVAMWGHAAAAGGRTDLLAEALKDVAGLVAGDGHFWELYNARSGAPDGGWQVGHAWDSQPDQTWSATGCLRMIHRGLFGIRHERTGLRLTPSLPSGWGPVTLRGFPYRRAVLDITLEGAGRRVTSATMDGHRLRTVPADLRGRHRIRVELA
ncbi:hypothetical protein B1H18_28110 [Streptomyces tsukubensis]|uniref:Mannosylglycerate hydrolase MGH1-like glycoside hydrolase domain-containing protein n=1 Tax=Streptomyces tsukubensis TaxID=83656 RepID=A0A1V4A2Y3_9ACTN|nr:hypothetical protein B1H18_28110 [Streptomyces tsukubensis]